VAQQRQALFYRGPDVSICHHLAHKDLAVFTPGIGRARLWVNQWNIPWGHVGKEVINPYNRI
jgi:hypothetical protein